MGLVYTNIQHGFRKANGLSNNEYVLMDMIFILHTRTDSKFQGWCYMKRSEMANEIGISRQGLAKMLNRLEALDLIVVDYETRFLKTTAKWQEVYFKRHDNRPLHDVNLVDDNGNKGDKDVNFVDIERQQSLHHNNNSYNDNNNRDTNAVTHSSEQIESFKKFENYILKNAPSVGKMKEPFTIDQFLKVKEKVSSKDMISVLLKMENSLNLLKNNKSANLTFQNWYKNGWGVLSKEEVKGNQSGTSNITSKIKDKLNNHN